MRKFKKNLAVFIVVIITFFLADTLVGFLIFKPDTAHRGIREFILSENSIPYYKSAPYLNYINYPGNKHFGINKAGLRNDLDIEIPKPENALRILFLGGSTTFGEVENSADAFPAILDKELNEYIQAQESPSITVKCMNGGMGAATSAEILTHYLFKYKYFNPDIVVIHAGINDAFTNAKFDEYTYQPDYHTSKRIMQDMPRLTKKIKQLCKLSYIASYYILNNMFERQLKSTFKSNDFFDYHQNDIWLEEGNDSMYSTNYNAFFNNISSLISVLHSENRKVLLVSEIVSYSKMPDELAKMLKGNIEHNTMLLNFLSEKHKIPIVILQKNDFPEDLFIDNDGIHVNEKGEKKKAELILFELINIINEILLS